MKFEYKVKKRYAYNKVDNNFYCEVRTKVPGSYVKMVVRSWTLRVDFSLNGTAALEPNSFDQFNDAINEARGLIRKAQQGADVSS